MSNLDYISAISSLSELAGPIAVSRLVVAINIAALQSKSRRTWTHIGKEIIERLSPSRANGYPASAVPLKCIVRWIKASAYSASPDFIFAAVKHSMSSISCHGEFKAIAATTLRVSTVEIASGYYRLFPTITNAIP